MNFWFCAKKMKIIGVRHASGPKERQQKNIKPFFGDQIRPAVKYVFVWLPSSMFFYFSQKHKSPVIFKLLNSKFVKITFLEVSRRIVFFFFVFRGKIKFKSKLVSVTVFFFFRQKNQKLGSATVFSPKCFSPAAGWLNLRKLVGLTNLQVPFWDFIFHRFYPFWKTRLSDSYLYKPAVLVWRGFYTSRIFVWATDIFLWKKNSSYTVNFTCFGKLVSPTVIFGAKNIYSNNSCL